MRILEYPSRMILNSRNESMLDHLTYEEIVSMTSALGILDRRKNLSKERQLELGGKVFKTLKRAARRKEIYDEAR